VVCEEVILTMVRESETGKIEVLIRSQLNVQGLTGNLTEICPCPRKVAYDLSSKSVLAASSWADDAYFEPKFDKRHCGVRIGF
jgi:hypothetical protein